MLILHSTEGRIALIYMGWRAKTMTRSYGKTPRPSRKLPTAPSAEIQINIIGRHTLEQLSLEVQRAIERLNVHGVTGVERFRVRLLPLDNAAAPMTLWNEHGQQIQAINIPDLPPEKPYRDNEPGVGVSPAGPGTRRKTAPRL